MAFGALIASRLARSGRTLTFAVAQASVVQRTAPPLLSRLGAVARALSTKPAAEDIIGIDLGAMNSCVSIMEGKTPQVIENADGGKTTPSIVAKNQNCDLLISITANRQVVTNALNTIRGSKHLIGRTFDDPQTHKEMKMVTYKIVRTQKRLIHVLAAGAEDTGAAADAQRSEQPQRLIRLPNRLRIKKSRESPMKIWSRGSIISPEYVGSTVLIHNGRTHVRCKITEAKVGHKFGEFAFTRRRRPHKTTTVKGKGAKGKK